VPLPLLEPLLRQLSAWSWSKPWPVARQCWRSGTDQLPRWSTTGPSWYVERLKPAPGMRRFIQFAPVLRASRGRIDSTAQSRACGLGNTPPW